MNEESQPSWLSEYKDRVWHNAKTAGHVRGMGGKMSKLLAPEGQGDYNPLLSDIAFNRHSTNDGSHVSPFDNDEIQVGLDGLRVRLVQGIDKEKFQEVLSRATKATTGISVDSAPDERDWEDMMRGGLQSALETQTIVFEVTGASRALTHQLVRSRKAGFHQQSQRATWFGEYPEMRMPESIARNERARIAFLQAREAAVDAYNIACEEDISYQDARFILPEAVTNYILCEYTVREFINVYAYRACSMFMWEMVGVMRMMGDVILEQSPWLADYIKISCEKTSARPGFEVSVWDMDGNPAGFELDPSKAHSCTFQGWENVEGQCDLPWGKEENRVFIPSDHLKIRSKANA